MHWLVTRCTVRWNIPKNRSWICMRGSSISWMWYENGLLCLHQSVYPREREGGGRGGGETERGRERETVWDALTEIAAGSPGFPFFRSLSFGGKKDTERQTRWLSHKHSSGKFPFGHFWDSLPCRHRTYPHLAFQTTLTFCFIWTCHGSSRVSVHDAWSLPASVCASSLEGIRGAGVEKISEQLLYTWESPLECGYRGRGSFFMTPPYLYIFGIYFAFRAAF